MEVALVQGHQGSEQAHPTVEVWRGRGHPLVEVLMPPEGVVLLATQCLAAPAKGATLQAMEAWGAAEVGGRE